MEEQRKENNRKFDPYTGNKIEDGVLETEERDYRIQGEPFYSERNWQKTKGLSTACLVLGILSILSAVSCCLTIFSIPFAIASFICGIMAGKSGDEKDKTRMVGFITSIVGIIASIIMIVVMIALTFSMMEIDYSPDGFYSEPEMEYYFEEGQKV